MQRDIFFCFGRRFECKKVYFFWSIRSLFPFFSSIRGVIVLVFVFFSRAFWGLLTTSLLSFSNLISGNVLDFVPFFFALWVHAAVFIFLSRGRLCFFRVSGSFRSFWQCQDIYPTSFGTDTISCYPVRLRAPYCNRNLSNFGSIFSRVITTVYVFNLSLDISTAKNQTKYWCKIKFKQSPVPA